MGKSRVGWAGMRAVGAACLFAAAAGHGTAWAGPKDSCTDANASLSSISAERCATVARSSGVSILEAATAAYSAARAYNEARDYSSAQAQIKRSTDLVTDDGLPAPEAKKRGALKSLRVARHIEMAKAQQGLGQIGGALAELAAAGPSENDVQYAEYYTLRANLKASQGDIAGARGDLEKVAATSEAARTDLVKLYLKESGDALTGNGPGGIDRLRTLVATYPQIVESTPAVPIQLGRIHLRIAEISESVSAREQYVSADRAFQIAIQSAEKLNQSAPQAEAYTGKGRALLGQGREAEAIAAFQKAVQIQPKADTQLAIGVAYARLERWTDSEKQFEDALKNLGSYGGSTDDLVEALITRAEVKQKLGRGEAQVRAALDLALSKDRTSPKPKVGIGRLLYQNGPQNDALALGYLSDAVQAVKLGAKTSDKDLADALLYRSLILAKRETVAAKPNWTPILGDADAAMRLSNAASPYKQNACILRILSSPRPDATACVDYSSEEGALLQGLAYLRTALNSSGVQRQSAFELADQAFNPAWYALRQKADKNTMRVRFLTPSRSPAPLVWMGLEYGKAMVTSCYRRAEYVIEEIPNKNLERSKADQLFRDLGAAPCK